ncbi:MAG: hypothetical protein EU539_12500 [Promethearchaeota archaeon]|nr:MAG: hypothetical protein EU539_12500 [Candidatus Lokiarchaeota archaeon]
MNNKELNWQIFGIFFILIVGSILHFLFELSGYFHPVGAISAVNESVWEHLKMGFWPILFLAPLEYKFLKNLTKNYIIAKCIAAYTIAGLIVVIFYTYTAILGTNMLLLDGLTFIISIIIGQYFGYRIIIAEQLNDKFTMLSWFLFILLAFSFILFTYFPPHLPIFRDSQTGLYGITDR